MWKLCFSRARCGQGQGFIRDGGGGVGGPSSQEENYGGLFSIRRGPLGVLVSFFMRLTPESTWSGH